MNREIEFRGYSKEMQRWVYGDLLINNGSPIIVMQVSRSYIGLTDVGVGNHWHIETPAYKVIPETVGQYTGLKDKHGKKIYEDDIVKVDDSVFGNPLDGYKCGIYKVGYFLPDCAFCLEQLDEKNAISFNEVMEYEVTGNIHDNPLTT